MNELPDFPVDDSTLSAIEHALGYCLTYEGEGGERLDEPRGIGADYNLGTLLDFLAGTMGEDPNEEVIDPGDPDAPNDPRLPGFLSGIGGARIVVDTRVHYSEHDVIAALITEIHRLREEKP